MGTDNLFKKKKAKKITKSGDLVAIICEGTKTEPNYINDFILDFRNSRNRTKIRVMQHAVTDPLNLVKQSITAIKSGYDIVYCVFDRDTHTNFDDAINLAKESKYKINLIISYPCFEFWLLLHFKDTHKPFGGNSPCCDCIKELKKVNNNFKDYKKGNNNIYALTKDFLEIATDRAKNIQNREGSKSDFYILLEGIKEFLNKY